VDAEGYIRAMSGPETTASTTGPLEVAPRFNGPTGSGNGGYTAGLLAERAATHPHRREECPVVEVTLRRPPPLARPMDVVHTDGPELRSRLLLDGELVAEARCDDEELPTVERVTLEAAVAASRSYPGHRVHPFPRCFSCGPDRDEGDGLRIFPGAVGTGEEAAGDRPRVAAPWLPHQSLAVASDLLDGVQRIGVAATWAALDCVGGWSSDLEGRPMVLGRMATRIDALPVVGEPHVLVGAELGGEGRKVFTASTLYDSDARVVARARHTWVAVDPAAFT
jgi:hypothetical protein